MDSTIDFKNIENQSSQMKKGVLEYCILAIIAQKEVYASDIIDQLKEADLLVVEGTLYPLLTRLKNNGFLQYQWVESNSGPPRKYYTITDEGKSFLQALHQSWTDLVKKVNLIYNQTK